MKKLALLFFSFLFICATAFAECEPGVESFHYRLSPTQPNQLEIIYRFGSASEYASFLNTYRGYSGNGSDIVSITYGATQQQYIEDSYIDIYIPTAISNGMKVTYNGVFDPAHSPQNMQPSNIDDVILTDGTPAKKYSFNNILDGNHMTGIFNLNYEFVVGTVTFTGGDNKIPQTIFADISARNYSSSNVNTTSGTDYFLNDLNCMQLSPNYVNTVDDFQQIDVVLPVTFGNISASLADNKLNVNWQTLKETNNDHFEIQTSKDGVTFAKLATVVSKAANGNSTQPIDYSFSQNNINSISYAGLSLLTIGGLLLLVFKRKKAIGFAAVTIGLAIFAIGCTKSDANVTNSSIKNLYVRILQVDKDGKSSKSNVVKVIEE